MMIIRTYFLVITLISLLSASNFTELSGFKDENGNIHLFLRIYTQYSGDGFSNDIFHFDIFKNSYSLYIEDYYSPANFPDPYNWPSYKSVDDFEF